MSGRTFLTPLRSQLEIALALITSLRGVQDPTARASHPTWDNGAELGLYGSYYTSAIGIGTLRF